MEIKSKNKGQYALIQGRLALGLIQSAQGIAHHIFALHFVKHNEPLGQNSLDLEFFQVFQDNRAFPALDQQGIGLLGMRAEGDWRLVEGTEFWQKDRHAGAGGKENFIVRNCERGMIRHDILTLAETTLINS